MENEIKESETVVPPAQPKINIDVGQALGTKERTLKTKKQLGEYYDELRELQIQELLVGIDVHISELSKYLDSVACLTEEEKNSIKTYLFNIKVKAIALADKLGYTAYLDKEALKKGFGIIIKSSEFAPDYIR